MFAACVRHWLYMLEAVPCNPFMGPLDRAIMLTASTGGSKEQLLLYFGAF